MSTNNLSTPFEKGQNEDSMISSSTTVSFSEPLTQDISKNKNVYLIPKNIEQRLIEILSFLQSDSNSAKNKIQILIYLQSLFMQVEFNSEIFLRKTINDKEKLNLYKIIIQQYVFHTNPENTKEEEENYRRYLLNLFLLLLSQVALEKDIYHYILSPIINFINEKNILNSNKKNLSGSGTNIIENDIVINFKPEHLSRVLTLLKYFYGYYKKEQSSNGILNYFFFSGDSDSSIVIPNKDHPFDNNKKLLNFDETLCVMMFIKVLPSEYIKALYPKVIFKLLELRFQDKKNPICINIDIDNQLTTPSKNEPLFKLVENEINCVIIKFNLNKKKALINCEINIGSNKVELPAISLIDSEKEKNQKGIGEIKEIILFKNFIGICTNIILYKEKKNEGLPKFLFPTIDNKRMSISKNDINEINKPRLFFPNGIYNEELYSYFANAEIKEKQDNILRKINLINSEKINYNIFTDFINNNLISIYIPTRYIIPSQSEEKTIQNTSQLILIDSINGLNAEFNTRTPALNGVHIFPNLYENDLSILGGLNHLLPILELMLEHNEFLNSENFSSFFSLLTIYVFCPKYQNALINDKSNFFKNLSYFLERIPDKFFNDELAENFKTILGFLCPPTGRNNYRELSNQFHNYILINEKILLKFNEDNQKNLINQICTTLVKIDFDIDIIKIIRILLNYDRNRKYKFCCRDHAQYFKENYSIMDPELSSRLQPIEKLLQNIFEKSYEKSIKNYSEKINESNQLKSNKKTSNKSLKRLSIPADYEGNNLYYLFYLLTYNISPCLQKMIISLVINFLKNHFENFLNIFDKKNELFDIILFVFKTSIFDVKIQAMNLLLLIDKNNNWHYLENRDIKIFIHKESLPIFLLDEVNDLPTEEKGKKEEKEEQEENDKNIEREENKQKEEKKEIKEKNIINDENDEKAKNEIIINQVENPENDENKEDELKNINIEEKNEININEDTIDKTENICGIKKETEIWNEKYILFTPTETEKKIYKKYNRKKYDYLVNNMYEKLIDYIGENFAILDLIIKIVSNGDLSLISRFISKIYNIIESPDISQNHILYTGITSSNYFLQFILDVNLQIYILINNKDKNKEFIPSFSINVSKNSNTLEELEVPMDESEKMDMMKKVLKDCQKIIIFIFSRNMTKLDYLLSWGKYYDNLKESNDIYNFIIDIFFPLFFDLAVDKSKAVTTLSETRNIKDIQTLTSIYYLNLFFEFITFFKLKYNDSFFQMNQKEINKILERDIKYILCNKDLQNLDILDPNQEMQSADSKITNFPHITMILKTLEPIIGVEQKYIKNENEISIKYMSSILNKNLFFNELEILFYCFDDGFFGNYIHKICNKGMHMVIILYNYFTCLLNVGGDKSDLVECFKNFRVYLSLLIMSPPSINVTESIKKKKWPNEKQNEEMRIIIQSIMFDSIYFLYNKLKFLKIQEKDYNSKEENEQNKKILEYISLTRRLYMENLGFILKILNKIYRGVKSTNKNNSFMNIFNNKNKVIEKLKSTGAYSFIDELYDECFTIHYEKAKNIEQNAKKIDKTRKYTMTSEHGNDDKQDQVSLQDSNIENKEVRSNSTKNIDDFKDIAQKYKNKSVNLEINTLNNINKENEEINDKNNLNENIIKENCLDDIEKINFFKEKDNKKMQLSDDDFKKLESYINLFLDDKNIENYFEKHSEYYSNNLYSFISTVNLRQKQIKTIIPAFDNRKNLSNRYPSDLCLVPYYYPENKYKPELMKKIEFISKSLREELKMSKRVLDLEEARKEEEYRNDKKKLFKFKGIWSYEDFFYDTKKYKLKYKLLNHLTNDFTKIFMTPIIDIDYYLPKFSQFKGDIFRNELSDSSVFPVTKIVDICFSKNKNKNDNNNTSENQKISIDNNINNTSLVSFDSLNYSSLSNLNDTKPENIINMNINPQFELNQEYYSFLKDQEIKEIKETDNLANNFNQKDFQIFSKFIEKQHLKDESSFLQSDACLVKLPYHIRGIIYINDKEIGFYSYETKRTEEDEDYDSDKKVCFGSIFKEQNEKYKNYHIRIPLKSIELIFKRRYYFKRNVLEIFVENKKSYFFRIDEKKFPDFINIILNNQNLKNLELEPITIDNTKSEEKIGSVNKNNLFYDYNNYNSLFSSKMFTTTMKNIYIKWTKWQISTFTLLNYLNLFASRSYHDINQYPVFPWIITDYVSENIPDLNSDNNPELTNASDYVPKIRPMNTPMGMMELNEAAKDRKDNYIINFESPDEKNPDENYDRYGSHYSTGLNLTYYLVRVFPFSYTRIEMQGKNFDDPNRLFNALDNSFECAISQKSDLRELIPEFFCFPEMFYNMNDLNLGEVLDEKTKVNKPVNDILLPPWSNNDGYMFIKYHREMLESPEISEKIHEWFNIIFGSKQKGKAAKKIHNQFLKQTYDIYDEDHNKLSPSEKIYQNRMVEFGVTPSQIFKNDLEKRLAPKNIRKKPILFEYLNKKDKKPNADHIFSWDVPIEIKIRESELYVEGEPYKVFSSWKKDEHEKILFLYNDKIKIISKTEKGFFRKSKKVSQKDIKNKESKEKISLKVESKEMKEIKDNIIIDEKEKENEINIENKESKEENSIIEDINEKINDMSIEEDLDAKDEEINEITSSKDISKYDRILFCPKYRMDIDKTPSVIYDKGNYIALGGFWNGQIFINKLDENKKGKNSKNINIIMTMKLSPITLMKIDQSETFIICTNKMGCIFIYSINKENKIEWILNNIIQDNQKEIVSFDLNENLNIFATSDKEGIINLYTFPQCKLFNSYKINENQIHANINTNITENNSYSGSRSESNINISLTQNDMYSDLVIISHNPLPCIIFYIRSKKCLCVFSINFHFISIKTDIELVPNGIKKYSDYFRKDYLFIYNKNSKTIDIYDIASLDIVAKSSKFDYTFIDFCFSKEMEHALIMVKIEEENKNENTKDKNKNYKILMLSSPGKIDGKES